MQNLRWSDHIQYFSLELHSMLKQRKQANRKFKNLLFMNQTDFWINPQGFFLLQWQTRFRINGTLTYTHRKNRCKVTSPVKYPRYTLNRNSVANFRAHVDGLESSCKVLTNLKGNRNIPHPCLMLFSSSLALVGWFDTDELTGTVPGSKVCFGMVYSAGYLY